MRLGQQGLLSPMACGGSFAGIFMRQCQTLCQPIVYKSRLYRHHVDVPPASIRRGARRRHCNTIECPAATSPSCPQHRDRPGRKLSSYGNFMISRGHYEYDASSVGIDLRTTGALENSAETHFCHITRRLRGADAARSSLMTVLGLPRVTPTRTVAKPEPKPTPLGQDGGQKTPY